MEMFRRCSDSTAEQGCKWLAMLHGEDTTVEMLALPS